MTDSMDINLIEGRTAQETAYLTLRNAAMVGTFKAGQQITIRGVAEKLDMSATPIREAFRRLSTERAFTVLENRRIMIPKLNQSRLEELIELRVSLETHAAVRAIAHLSDRRIETLIQLDNEANEALKKKDHATVVVTNQKFHSSLYKSNPEQIIMPMIESVWLQIGPVLKNAARSAMLLEHDYHIDIIGALKDRDTKALSKAIESDIRTSILLK
ncbi:MAG: GntR family transcriptional regulator [Litorimonas sp.]